MNKKHNYEIKVQIKIQFWIFYVHSKTWKRNSKLKKIMDLYTVVVFCHDFLNFIQSVYCHTVVCRHGFFHKAGAHTFTNHFQKSVSVYDMYFLSYVWFFFLSFYLCTVFASMCVQRYIRELLPKYFWNRIQIPCSIISRDIFKNFLILCTYIRCGK